MASERENNPSFTESPWRAAACIRIEFRLWIFACAISGVICAGDELRASNTTDNVAHVRVNQVGYLEQDAKIAVAFSHQRLDGTFSVLDRATGDTVHTGVITPSIAKGWGAFAHYYTLDFSAVKTPGRYFLRLEKAGSKSSVFRIGNDAYGTYQADLLVFMRQQRCGYNPLLDVECHQQDGRTAYGPRPEGTHIDVTGGWHDAGDQLKYLITSSNATARMLLAFELDPEKFGDVVDQRGNSSPNGIPDVLDEAKWGLNWMHKMHPRPDELYHQIADDRDHTGWKMPNQDKSDYGWGANSYRVVYFADGKPQGLAKYKSKATGIANLAGRYAAAMAMGYRIWKEELNDETFAARCLQAAVEVYQLGKASEGYQQGNSYGAPYRYTEDTWADDMEWGAAELYKATGNKAYLDDARRYAKIIGSLAWMPHETTGHYQFYPYVNVGHFALYPHVGGETQKELASYYRAGIDATLKRGERNPYRIGVPFIWCSNNLTVALITQVILYERMTGDLRYHDFMLAQRDWLLGRNPWGTSMFTGIPRTGEYPEDVHTSVWYLTRRMVPGGLVDGPVYGSVYRELKGLHLTEPDEFAQFQNEYVVYHDDIGDYSTNEPTMDGTADAITMMAYFGTADPTSPRLSEGNDGTVNTVKSFAVDPSWTLDEGGIVRGSRDNKELAFIFTGSEYGEGTETILDVLEAQNVKASFFVTGKYIGEPAHEPLLRRMVEDGHYLGPHSHGHLLYSSWEDRSRSLVSERAFKKDLRMNLSELHKFGACDGSPVYFVPPYEWYNARHVQWARDVGCVLCNFTPGSGSHRDWAPEDHTAFRPSAKILSDILASEARDSDGLNGHLLLLHLGSARRDKMHGLLRSLIGQLRGRGYGFVRVDTLLAGRQ